VAVTGFPNMPALLLSRAAAAGGTTILRRKQRGIWTPVDWATLGARARAIGTALKLSGLKPGDVVALLSDASTDWIAADLAIQGAACVSMALYPTDDAETVAAQLRHGTAKLLFVENEEQLDKALGLRAACPDLSRIVIMDMKGLRGFDDPGCEGLDAFAARGETRAGEWEASIAAIMPGDLAAIVITAGSAGPPRGVMLTHGNIMHQVARFAAASGQGPTDERLAFLPVCSVTERVLGLYAALLAGTVTNLVENAETVPENLQEVRPTVMIAMPRIWEKFHARVTVAVAEAGRMQAWLYAWALRIGLRGSGNGPLHRIARLLVLDRVRAAIGLDRLRWAGVAGAAIAPELVAWYRAVGIDLIETYGTTECAGLACMMPAGERRPGMAGKPVPWGELKIAADGEILLRGPHVSPGYWHEEAMTATALRGNWLHTGDMGALDRGYLRIVGRRTDLLQVDDALVAPSALEAALKVSPYIADALVIGDGRPALTCLVMLESDAVEKWAQDNNVPHTSFASLVQAERVGALIGREVARVNAGAANPITDFRIIARRLAPEDRELTPTMKLRRGVVMQAYGALIDDMYRPALPS